MSDQDYAKSQLVEGFFRRGHELGAKSEALELATIVILTQLAGYRAMPGKEREYLGGFVDGAMHVLKLSGKFSTSR